MTGHGDLVVKADLERKLAATMERRADLERRQRAVRAVGDLHP